MDTTAESLHPIAILVDELRSEDVTLRLNAIHRISTIALALGPERTRHELIPFLADSVDDDDEILLALAEELGQEDFVEYVGGREQAHFLLLVLENLATVEETLVREKACEGIARIAGVLSQSQVETHLVPLVKRLATAEWFTSRTSATALFPATYAPATPETQAELRKLYVALSADDTPMVKRAAAKELGPFCRVLSREDLLQAGLPVFRKLASDDQDSVRLLTVEALIDIAGVLSDAEAKTYLGEAMKDLVVDKSWRVRYMVAENFVRLARAVTKDADPEIGAGVLDELVVAFVALLRDNEAEVRSAVATQVPGFCALLDVPTILERAMPAIGELIVDPSQHVRAALAKEIAGLAPLLGKEATTEHLLPVFIRMLNDDFPEVRLNVISKLEQVNAVIGIESLSNALLPAIIELAEDKQWRIRQAIIDHIPLLAKQLGVEFFNDRLSTLCLEWLSDSVFSIRESATTNLFRLAEIFGLPWAEQVIIPNILHMAETPNYLHRMTTLFAVGALAPIFDLDILKSAVLPTVTALLTDRIPNVRFNVAKTLEMLATQLASLDGGDALITSEVVPSLEVLQKDQDADVRFFAEKALASIAAERATDTDAPDIKTAPIAAV